MSGGAGEPSRALGRKGKNNGRQPLGKRLCYVIDQGLTRKVNPDPPFMGLP